jgi:hemerythrin-like domain-containing protein
MATRHPALVPLARDHHDGLLLAIRLQQGAAALTKLWSHDRTVQAQYVREFHRQHLLPHFAAEEEDLFPLIDVHAPGLRPMRDRLVADHRFFERTAEELALADPTSLERVLTEYGRRLEEHIRREDRELFPAIERQFPPEALDDLRRAMESRYGNDQTNRA